MKITLYCFSGVLEKPKLYDDLTIHSHNGIHPIFMGFTSSCSRTVLPLLCPYPKDLKLDSWYLCNIIEPSFNQSARS
jgi:hypothetical protein